MLQLRNIARKHWKIWSSKTWLREYNKNQTLRHLKLHKIYLSRYSSIIRGRLRAQSALKTMRQIWRTQVLSLSSKKVPTASVSFPETSKLPQQRLSALTVKRLSRVAVKLTRDPRRSKTPCLPSKTLIKTNHQTAVDERSCLRTSSARYHPGSSPGLSRQTS